MANNAPFIFGGVGNGQAAPSFPSHPQHNNNAASSTASAASPAQQAAFQQNAQLPGIDMSALAGISPEQLALIQRLMLSGALPLPPQAPPTSATAAAQLPVPPTATPVFPAQNSNAPQQDIDMDREEGEVEEGQNNSTLMSDANETTIKIPPRGPKSMISRRSSRQASTSGRPSRAATPPRRPSSSRGALSVSDHNSQMVYMAKEQQSQDFVLAMHQAGYTYRQLAAMVEDPKPLRRMFKQLGLPVSSDHGLSHGSVSLNPPSQPQPPDVSTAASRSPADNMLKPPAVKPPTQAKAPAKADRSAYLAKLQALKAGKAGTTMSPSTPQAPAQTASPAQPLSNSSTPAATAPAASATAATPMSKAVKTELARQRLEAFKAERAAKLQAQVAASAAAASSAATPTKAPQVAPANGLGSGLHAIAGKVEGRMSEPVAQEEGPASDASRQTFSPTVPTPDRSFSGLPGLFTNKNIEQAPVTAVSQPSSQPDLLSQKRPIPDTNSVAPTPSKRPFGQSRSASEDESFIIENSDDEDEDSPMDIDSASAAVDIFGTPAAANTGPTAPASISDASNSTTYEQKLKAIKELNRKIAEKEAKKKAAAQIITQQVGAATLAPGLPGISSPSTAGVNTSVVAGYGSDSPAALFAPERPVSAGASKLRQQKEELRQRIAELENARRAGGAAKTAGQPIEPTTDSAPEPIQPVEAMRPVAMEEQLAPNSDMQAVPPPIPAPVATGEAQEDGEIDDESDFDFYADDEAADASRIDGAKVASQDITISDVFNAAAVEQPYPLSPSPEEDDEEVAPALSNAAAADRMVEDIDAEEVIARSNTASTIQSGAAMGGGEDPVGATLANLDPAKQEMELEGEVNPGVLYEEEEDEEYHPAYSIDQRMDAFDNQHESNDARSDGEVSDASSSYDLDARADDGDEIADVESSDASSESSTESDTYESEPAAADVKIVSPRAAETKHEADDLAAELQADQDEPTEPTDQQFAGDESKKYYTPYESIMTKFKDYRYHPSYLQAVPNGFHSRTYNHQIDANRPLCETELLGGICYERGCTGQHFDKMAISDNVLLQQMGTKNVPAQTKDELTKWNHGLQEVIKALKADDVRDAASIAARIAQYRRDFVGDPSRVITIR